MITLTTAAQINSVLGGNSPISYDKLVLTPFTMDPVKQTVTGNLRLTSTANADMQPITGTLTIVVTSSELRIEVPQIDFYRRIVLTAGQKNAILNQIEAAQAELENGLVTLGVISGTRSAGA